MGDAVLLDDHFRVLVIRTTSQPALEMNEVVLGADQVELPLAPPTLGDTVVKSTLERQMTTILPMPDALEETFHIVPLPDSPGNHQERRVDGAGSV